MATEVRSERGGEITNDGALIIYGGRERLHLHHAAGDTRE